MEKKLNKIVFYIIMIMATIAVVVVGCSIVVSKKEEAEMKKITELNKAILDAPYKSY